MLKFLRNRAEPCEIYLSRANRHILGKLNVLSAKFHPKLLDIWELDIEIAKHKDKEKNPYYESIKQYMEIYVPNVGWFRINGHPDETYDYSTGTYQKHFTAYGYETQLQDIDLHSFYINSAEPLSMEMYPENLDALGIPQHNIQFYISNANEDITSENYWGLGLLNIIEHEYCKQKGWSIGHVDTGLISLRGRMFQIDSQDLYSFLMQEASKAYKCIFIFDGIAKTINAYQIDNYGKYLNIELNRRNLLNSVRIESQRDVSYTQFQVAGASDETTIAYVNFGSETIENISYYIADGQLSDSCSTKYENYLTYRESRRDDYADTVRDFLKVKQRIDLIHQQIPIDECAKKWSAYDTETLLTELEQFTKLKEALELKHTVDSVLQIEETPDYSIYISIGEAIIPSIQGVLDARESGEEETELDYRINWELYGIDELTVLKKNYENQVKVLADKGYDLPWEEGNSGNQNTHNKHHENYLTYQEYVEAIEERLTILSNQVSELQAQLDNLSQKRIAIAEDVNIENKRFGFTQEELEDIYSLYVSTDYTDSTIEVQSLDDIDAVIELSKELLESAKKELAIESRPQLRFSVDSENPLLLEIYKDAVENLKIGNFIFIDLDDSHQANQRSNSTLKVKQRIVGYTIELVDLSDASFQLEFSDMVRCNGIASDDEYLLAIGNSSQKNSISKSVSNYVNQASATIASQVLNSYFSSGNNSLFPNGLSSEDLQKLADALDGLIGGTLSLDELRAQIAKIDSLEANSAFIKYLNSQILISDNADFKNLQAKIAAIDNLLAGNFSAELGHIIKLTADNVNIDEAVIKELIAAQILVSDLQAGDITLTDTMRILSANGLMEMNGETLQIMGTTPDGDQYVAIQLGYDTNNNPSLIIRNETGAVMLDASGLHENIIPDGLIKNSMIGNGEISKDKLNFHTVEADENGNIDIKKVQADGQGLDVAFTTFKNDVNNKIDSLQIGGRNLLQDSAFPIGTKKWNLRKATIDKTVKFKGNNTVKITGANTERLDVPNIYYANYNTGENLVLSLWLMSPDVTKVTNTVSVMIGFRNGDRVANGYVQRRVISSEFADAGNNTWFKVELQGLNNLPENIYCTFMLQPNNPDATIYVANPKLEYGNIATEWSPAPEDTDAKIVEVQSSVTAVNLRVDNVEKEIELKATKTEVNNQINGIKSDLAEANAGKDKWHIEIYEKSSLPESSLEQSSLDVLFGQDVLPSNTIDISDQGISTTLPFGTDYIGYAVTFVKFSERTSVIYSFDMTDVGTLYCNGKIVNPNNNGDITLTFSDGWNVLEVVWNVSDDSNAGGFQFSEKISSHEKCELMNCYYQTITSRQSSLVDRYVGTKITVDQMETRLSNTESVLITKADGTQVHELFGQLNETISTVESFRRTVSETYITNDYKTEVSSQIEQLVNQINNKVTMDDVTSLVSQTASSWRLDFAQNGASCGSVQINATDGIVVSGADNSQYKTIISSSEFAGYYNNQRIFWLNQDETVTERLRVDKGADFRTVKLVPVTQDGYRGLDFLSGNAQI